MFDLSRRDFAKLTAAGALGLPLSGWLHRLAARTAGRKTAKACILLWMDGGPSHKDTFDLKPGTKDGGEFQPIPTSVPGVQISEHFPELAKLMEHGSILRGMCTAEGAHARAKYNLHTGYREGVGGIVHPSIGSIVSSELDKPDFPLPNYVAVGGRSYGAGFLGTRHQPLMVSDPSKGVENLRAAVAESQFADRLGLLEELEAGFLRTYKADAGAAHKTTYARAVELMQSSQAKAFDLSKEPEKVKAAYGAGRFGEGCLLARRLVETGVTFVEVALGGWDTHQDNFDRVKTLSRTVDPAMSALIRDLKERGLLDSTLVIWMGEFGRTPKINSRGAKPGRDHYPKAWSSLVFGGGLKGGQVIGKTDAEGAAVTERPISALDFLATVCLALGIDPDKKNETPGGRPLRIVDKGHKAITELLG
jgi:hypothetical protein